MRLPDWLKSAEAFSMAAGGPTRSDTYLLNVQIQHPVSGNMINYGTFDKMTGGELSSGATQYNPGGMAPPVSLGGRKTTSNVVVSRLYRLGRDHDVIQQILDGVGKSRMVVTKQPLDIEGNTYGKPIIFQGVLDRCKEPEVDSETSTAGLLELEMVVEGYPTT
jgi:voltage-gated potassium channel Kch